MRIVSLLPAATESVCALGLADRLVGVSHECVLPEALGGRPAVTRSLIAHDATSREIDRVVREHSEARQPLYSLDVGALTDLQPDLIITQTLCNVCAVSGRDVRAALRSLPPNTEVLDIEARTLGDVLDGIRIIASRAGVAEAGDALIRDLTLRIEAVEALSKGMRTRPRVAFIEWLDPIFAAGHWNPELIELAGGFDPLGRAGEAARSVRWEDVETARPEVIFVACCGFDVDCTVADLAALATRPAWSDLPAVRDGRVYVADGRRYFSAPGPSLVDSLEILAHALDPVVHPMPLVAPPATRVEMESSMATFPAPRL